MQATKAKKKQLNERKKVFERDSVPLQTRDLDDKKAQRKAKLTARHNRFAAHHAAAAEVLLPDTEGFIETENPLEKTWRLKQSDIVKGVDLQTAEKKFQLKLSAGPYVCNFSHNGRFCLLAGERGHVASFDWVNKKPLVDTLFKETVRDAVYMHNNTLFAVAQRKYVYMYDGESGAEVHCMRQHFEPTKLAFLRYHFLLVSTNTGGVLRYQDTSTGSIVTEIPTGLGQANVMEDNKHNGIMHLGHGNGTVTMWSPNTGKALVQMLCHKGAVTCLAIDLGGRHMVTGGIDAQVKVWDLRSYKSPISYYSHKALTSLDISQKGLLAVAFGKQIRIWRDALSHKQAEPYLSLLSESIVHRLRFVPFEDVLGIAHEKGFETAIVPGAGEPNFDALEANPFETGQQRSEAEVRQLLEKLPAETITLDPSVIGAIQRPAEEETSKKRKLSALANDKPVKVKNRTKGRNTASKRLKRKSANIIDEKMVQ